MKLQLDPGNDAKDKDRQVRRVLRGVFLAGALTDALALIPLLHSGTARLLWGLQAGGEAQRFVSHSAAALMLGWTMLLWWASRKPLERRDIAALTLVVIIGLIVAEITAVMADVVPARKMISTWTLQVILSFFFVRAYLSSSERVRQESALSSPDGSS